MSSNRARTRLLFVLFLSAFFSSQFPSSSIQFNSPLSASGDFVAAFPDQCRAALTTLYPIWLSSLQENVVSVRESSAVALGKIVRAFKGKHNHTQRWQITVLRHRFCMSMPHI